MGSIVKLVVLLVIVTVLCEARNCGFRWRGKCPEKRHAKRVSCPKFCFSKLSEILFYHSIINLNVHDASAAEHFGLCTAKPGSFLWTLWSILQQIMYWGRELSSTDKIRWVYSCWYGSREHLGAWGTLSRSLPYSLLISPQFNLRWGEFENLYWNVSQLGGENLRDEKLKERKLVADENWREQDINIMTFCFNDSRRVNWNWRQVSKLTKEN